MEFITAMMPLLNIGFFAAVVARFTGANLSALVLCSLLYLGATPVQTVGMMLTFMVFMKLTYHTQGTRLTWNKLRIFKGWRILIPVLFIAVIIVSNPFYGVAAFAGFFLMEVLAMLYREQPRDDRMPKSTWITAVVIGTVVGVAGLLALKFIPAEFYYLVAGTIILLICAAAWWLGKDRSRLSHSWDLVIYGAQFFLGLCGLEISDWLTELQRPRPSMLARHLSMVMVPVVFCTFVAAMLIYSVISLSGLITALAATIATRFFGYYEGSGKGAFSYLALGMTVFAVVCLFLVQPEPVGVKDLLFISSPNFELPWNH